MHNTKFKNRPVVCPPHPPRPPPEEGKGLGGRRGMAIRRTSIPHLGGCSHTHTTRCSCTIVSSSVACRGSGRAPARQRQARPPGRISSPSWRLLRAPLWRLPAPPCGQSSPRSWGQEGQEAGVRGQSLGPETSARQGQPNPRCAAEGTGSSHRSPGAQNPRGQSPAGTQVLRHPPDTSRDGGTQPGAGASASRATGPALCPGVLGAPPELRDSPPTLLELQDQQQ